MKPEEAHKYTVTFKSEFTTPMELPDGYSVLEWDITELWHNDILRNVPSPGFLGDDMKFLGWDKEPNQAVVTGDMTFTAKFDNDGCVPIFFKPVDEDGKSIKALLVPGSFVYEQAVAVVKAGDKLTEKTVPPTAFVKRSNTPYDNFHLDSGRYHVQLVYYDVNTDAESLWDTDFYYDLETGTTRISVQELKDAGKLPQSDVSGYHWEIFAYHADDPNWQLPTEGELPSNALEYIDINLDNASYMETGMYCSVVKLVAND